MAKALLRVDFHRNWNNKLGNMVFTTIRKWTPDKEIKYRSNQGKQVEVFLKGVSKGRCKLIRVDIKKYLDLADALLVLDTGETSLLTIHGLFQTFGMESVDDKMIVLWLQRVN